MASPANVQGDANSKRQKSKTKEYRASHTRKPPNPIKKRIKSVLSSITSVAKAAYKANDKKDVKSLPAVSKKAVQVYMEDNAAKKVSAIKAQVYLNTCIIDRQENSEWLWEIRSYCEFSQEFCKLVELLKNVKVNLDFTTDPKYLNKPLSKRLVKQKGKPGHTLKVYAKPKEDDPRKDFLMRLAEDALTAVINKDREGLIISPREAALMLGAIKEESRKKNSELNEFLEKHL